MDQRICDQSMRLTVHIHYDSYIHTEYIQPKKIIFIFVKSLIILFTKKNCYTCITLTLGSPLVCPGHLHWGTWFLTRHSAFRPQELSLVHGSLQVLSIQAAVLGQSESAKQSPGCLHPNLNGSPIRPFGHIHLKEPSIFWHL